MDLRKRTPKSWHIFRGEKDDSAILRADFQSHLQVRGMECGYYSNIENAGNGWTWCVCLKMKDFLQFMAIEILHIEV